MLNNDLQVLLLDELGFLRNVPVSLNEVISCSIDLWLTAIHKYGTYTQTMHEFELHSFASDFGNCIPKGSPNKSEGDTGLAGHINSCNADT